jgi:hypothetical protein
LRFVERTPERVIVIGDQRECGLVGTAELDPER